MPTVSDDLDTMELANARAHDTANIRLHRPRQARFADRHNTGGASRVLVPATCRQTQRLQGSTNPQFQCPQRPIGCHPPRAVFLLLDLAVINTAPVRVCGGAPDYEVKRLIARRGGGANLTPTPQWFSRHFVHIPKLRVESHGCPCLAADATQRTLRTLRPEFQDLNAGMKHGIAPSCPMLPHMRTWQTKPFQHQRSGQLWLQLEFKPGGASEHRIPNPWARERCLVRST